MNAKKAMKRLGEKIAETQVLDLRTPPLNFYQPKPPAKLQEKAQKLNQNL